MNFYQSRRIFTKTVCSLRLLSRSRSQKLNDGYAHRLSQRYSALSHSARLPLSSRQHTTWKTTNVSSEGRLSENITGICFTPSRWYSTELPVDDVNIDVTQLVSIMEKGDPYLIDIREPQELAERGSIPEAVNIPLGELESALEMAPRAYKSLYGREKPDATKATVILFCASGNRSYRAVMLTRELGFKRSWHLVKGFNYWKECQEQE
ncbi:thiosulfate:glutathione sulfurtransferase-like [Haliotis rufescens]|uniref:thiosulfate:glutathione sulfurtransferase-like n=1 Tax=Haliotis rufescens TaxID=6454 RepID=UPI00201E951F|nr:thiosulfate:glutathione sulfurtransferase-like [Haliotis rufescens]